MLYLSIAIVIVAIIFTVKPPTFTLAFNKTITVNHTDTNNNVITTQSVDVNDPEVKKLMEDIPPTLDDLVATLNETIHNISGGEN